MWFSIFFLWFVCLVILLKLTVPPTDIPHTSQPPVIFLTLYLYNSNCLLSERICVWNVVTLHLLLFLYYSYLSILDFFSPLTTFSIRRPWRPLGQNKPIREEALERQQEFLTWTSDSSVKTSYQDITGYLPFLWTYRCFLKIIFKIYLFSCLWLCWLFTAVHGFSLAAVLTLRWLLLLQSIHSR